MQIYKRYKKEIPVDDAQKALCEQIDQRMEQIEKYKTDISELKVKNKRFCPSCGSPLAKDDAFCSQCGAACPTVEPEEDAGDDVIEGTAEEVAKLVYFLGTAESSYITGQVINVDGGMVM